MLDELVERLNGRRPAFGCYFNCAGRGRGLFGVADHDVTLIREASASSRSPDSSATASSRRSAAGTSSTTTPAPS